MWTHPCPVRIAHLRLANRYSESALQAAQLDTLAEDFDERLVCEEFKKPLLSGASLLLTFFSVTLALGMGTVDPVLSRLGCAAKTWFEKLESAGGVSVCRNICQS